jgi:transposase
MHDGLLSHPDGSASRGKLVAKDPTPRFRSSRTRQLDVLLGCLEEQVPPDHLARSIWALVEKLDTSALEKHYSALGRRGYHPKRLLAVWVYASLIGMHYSTEVERACRTDAAFKWLCGGDSPSGPTLRRMRMKQASFFAAAIEQTVLAGSAAGLVDLSALAVDSVRIRAHASPAAVRTESRSTERLKELSKVDVSSLDEQSKAKHDASVKKHADALAVCAERDVTSFVLTNELAALMKFPSGASAPAHRATVVSTGASSRFVVGVLVDASSSDHGKLKESLEQVRGVLDKLGLRSDQPLVAAADAGYWSDRDLQFAQDAVEWVDVLIPEIKRSRESRGFFGRNRFVVDAEGKATCPAGTTMLGPYANDKERRQLKWVGVGCASCTLKPQCTPGRERSLHIDAAKERAREVMRERLTRPGAKERYNKRIATIEPVFSFLEHTMRFRRASSRRKQTVVSEVLLKLLAYNIDRLIRAERDATRFSCVLVSISFDGTYQLISTEF